VWEPIGELEQTLTYDRALASVGGYEALLLFVERHARAVGIDDLSRAQARMHLESWRLFGSRRGFLLPEYLELVWAADRLR